MSLRTTDVSLRASTGIYAGTPTDPTTRVADNATFENYTYTGEQAQYGNVDSKASSQTISNYMTGVIGLNRSTTMAVYQEYERRKALGLQL